MPTLAVSVPILSRTPSWQEAKKLGWAMVLIAGKPVRLKLVPRPTPVAQAFAFECPNPACRARSKSIWIDDQRDSGTMEAAVLGCNRCLRLKRRHPANIHGTAFHRMVVRPCLQLQGIDRRLAVRGLHPNVRRRLKRRRARLLARVEQALAERRALMRSGVHALAEELAAYAAHTGQSSTAAGIMSLLPRPDLRPN